MGQMTTMAAILVLITGCISTDEKRKKASVEGPATGAETYAVAKVLSGDTVRLSTGETVRYAGIKAPGTGEEFFVDARLANERLVFGTEIRVRVKFIPGMHDDKGLRYVHIYTPGAALRLMTWINAELLESGWGRLCYRGLDRSFESRFEAREAVARKTRRGIWKNRG